MKVEEAEKVIKTSIISYDKKGSEYYQRHKEEDHSEVDFVRQQTRDWWRHSRQEGHRDKEEVVEYIQACQVLGFEDLAEAITNTHFKSEEITPEDIANRRVCWECRRSFKSSRGRKIHSSKAHKGIFGKI